MEAKAVEFHFNLDVFSEFSKCYSNKRKNSVWHNWKESHRQKLSQNDVAIYSQYFILTTASSSAQHVSRSENKVYLLLKAGK